MKICEKCGKIVSYNSYFKAYYCEQCGHYEPKKEVKANTNTLRNYNTSISKDLVLSK